MLSVRGVDKRYGATRALAGLDLDAEPGVVLGIAGPNGAGKSTLVRILGGLERPDDGVFTWSEEPWQPWAPPRRVTVVHQEPQLFPNLTVAENIVAQDAHGSRWPRMSEDQEHILAELSIDRYANTRLEACSLAIRQLTAIARALSQDAEMLIFDEPNSALTEEESSALFQLMGELAASGRLVALVSHRLSDLERHCGRVAVVLDGRVSVLLEGADVNAQRIARELVTSVETARDVREGGGDPKRPSAREVGLSIRGFTHPRGAFADVDLDIRSAEVTVLLGAEGGGAREFLLALAGLESATGKLRRLGRSAAKPVEYVAADRRLSLFQNASVASNLVARLGRPTIATSFGFLRGAAIRRVAEQLRADYVVRSRDPSQPITDLSGGNQQKVAIAAAMARAPGLLILEEPTRGVDITSKAEIYALLRSYAREGGLLVILTTEVLEAFEAGDRVIVFEHTVRGELTVDGYGGPAELATDLAAIRAGAA